MYIERLLEPAIKSHLFKQKALIIYGARQVGKTTLVKKILADLNIPSKYLNCDEMDIQNALREAETSAALKQLIGESKLVIIDEAQRIKNIGLKLKLLIDNFTDIQIIATGSSSLDLANEITEPLTGRSVEFWLYQLSIKELLKKNDKIEMSRNLENYLIYGMYPTVAQAKSSSEKSENIKYLASNYLYKDILKVNNLKNSEIITKLLTALALQIGNEVSYSELSNLVGTSKQSISEYIDLLEKVFVIFRLQPFSRNLRKEIAKSRKIYFYDLGIRNALINNQNPLSLRGDTRQLWENFVIAEKIKTQFWLMNRSNLYFWRTYDQQEIDLIEEKDGKLQAFEIKYKATKKVKCPIAWKNAYRDSEWKVIDKDNFWETLD
ncbi:ATPase [Candidatus Peregrinibacteria bacterium CG08_land_8_20_14_0_20_41_10]|nr:MAG: ATPase [Candidatus Peregrinibacteria bacterium CG08_land_8_20_14_0_20_41_10]